MIGWGVMGAGGVADTAVGPGITRLDDARVVGCVDVDPERAGQFASKHGGRVYSSYEDLLADEAVDVVYIATPNALHAEQVVAAAAAGKHVLAEKPLATSVEDARQALAACERAGVKLAIDFQTRRHEGMDEVRETIADGDIGDVLLVQCEVSPGRVPLGSWRSDLRLAHLGTINNIGVHAYDLLRYLLGAEVEEVTMLSDAGREDRLETIALALLRFDNGTLAYVNANQAVPNFQPDLVVYGTEGRIVGRSVSRPFLKSGEFTILSHGEERTIPSQSMDCYDRTVAAFSHAIAAGEQPSPSGEDAVRSVELTEAMARSARTGETVRL